MGLTTLDDPRVTGFLWAPARRPISYKNRDHREAGAHKHHFISQIPHPKGAWKVRISAKNFAKRKKQKHTENKNNQADVSYESPQQFYPRGDRKLVTPSTMRPTLSSLALWAFGD